MNKKIIIAIVIVVIVAAAAVLIFGRKKNTSNTSTTSSSSASNTSSSGGALSSTSMTPNFMINANDDGADHETVTVKKGATVTIMFMVDTSGVYHGGLQLKSTDPQIDSGPIAPGSSKSVTFTADHSFTFQPYWYASGVKKNYLITVTVN